MDKVILNLKGKNNHLHIVAIESKTNKYDTTYFGIVKMKSFKTYCYFTQTQIDFLSEFFHLSPTNDVLKTSSFFKSKTLALNMNYYLNTFLIMRMFKYDQYDHDAYDINIRENIVKPYTNYPFFGWLLSDRTEVVFKEAVTFSFKKFVDTDFSYHLTEDERIFLKKFNTYQDFKDFYFIPKEFNKDFDKFFEKNKICLDYKTSYKVNANLFRSIHFVKDVFGDSIKNAKDYVSIVEHVQNNKKSFFSGPSVFKEDAQKDFKYCFNKLAPNKQLTKIKKWHFYHAHLERMVKHIKLFEKFYSPDYEKFDDPLFCYSFYSKKYNKEEIKDFNLKNINKDDYNTFLTDFSKVSLIENYKIKLIQTNFELIKIGSFLHNCAGGVDNSEYYEKHLNFIVYEDAKKPLFLGSIKAGRIDQLKGFKNAKPSKELFKNVILELSKNGILKDYSKKLSTEFNDFYKDCCVQSYNN